MKTNHIAFKCLKCGGTCVFPARTSDGRLCPTCKGYIVPTGYVSIGIDFASGPDITVETPPVRKNGD